MSSDNKAAFARSWVGTSPDEVAAAEIRSLKKPGARVWIKQTPNVFFLSSKEKALDKLEEKLKPEDKK